MPIRDADSALTLVDQVSMKEALQKQSCCATATLEFTHAMAPKELHIKLSEWGHTQMDLAYHRGQPYLRVLVGPPPLKLSRIQVSQLYKADIVCKSNNFLTYIDNRRLLTSAPIP